MNRKIVLLIAIAIVGVAIALPAQEDEVADPELGQGPADTAGPQIGFGVESIQDDGETWTRVHLFPIFSLGKFRFAFDVEVFIDPEGNLSDRGWNFDTVDSSLDSIARKIYFVQYNDEDNVTDGEDNLYARAGALDSVTLGQGILMRNYRNTLGYPLERRIGVELTLGNLTAVDFGVEGVVTDVTDFARDGGVIGARTFFSPLAPTDIPLLRNLEIGVSAVTDINQFAALRDSDGDDIPDGIDNFPDDDDRAADTDEDGVADSRDIDLDGDNIADFSDVTDPTERQQLRDILGAENVDDDVTPENLFSLEGKQDSFTMVAADVRMPILPFLDIYAAAGMSVDPDQAEDDSTADGWGFAAPGLFLDLMPVLSFDLAYRQRDGEFQFGYFGESYDNLRAQILDDGSVVTKDNLLADETVSGVYGALTANLYIIEVFGAYEFLAPLDGDSNNAMTVEARASLNRERLAQIPVLSNYLAGLDAYYIDESAETFEDLFDPDPSVLIGARLQLALGESTVLNYEFQRAFDENGDAVDTMVIGTETSF